MRLEFWIVLSLYCSIVPNRATLCEEGVTQGNSQLSYNKFSVGSVMELILF